MRPLDLQHIGNELAIKWEDESEGFVSLEKLRRACPCASCRGETDVMGQVHKGPKQSFLPESFQPRRLAMVGGYAVQIFWGDGHGTGIYSWELLRDLAAGD